MKTLMIYITVMAALLQTATVDKEKYKADFKKIQAAFKSYPNISFNVSYSDHHDMAGDTSISAKYCFKGRKFYYALGQVEVIKNDELIISINHKKKDIVLYNSSDFKDDYLPMGLLDSFFSRSNVNLQYTETNKGKTGSYIMTFTNKQKIYNRMDLEFDKSTYLTKKMKLYVTPEKAAGLYSASKNTGLNGASIDYVFSNYKFSTIDDKLFSTGTYVKFSDNKFKAVNQYAGYHVVSLIPIQPKK